MKLRSVVTVMSAALVGVTTPGFAQADHGNGNRRAAQVSHNDHRAHRDGGNSAGLAIALGIGLLGLAAIASQHDDTPQPYAYAPPPQPYGYAPNYGYGYSADYDRDYSPRRARGYAPGYPPVGYDNQGSNRGTAYANGGRGYIYPEANPTTGY